MSWADQTTAAHAHMGSALAVVDSILSFVKDGKGKPSRDERALFAAAVAFAYGIWENFVEQLAIEIVKNMARELPPASLPEHIRRQLEKRTAWELSVSPGWRDLWVAHVTMKAVGDGETYGINTAREKQVKDLLMQVGPAEPFRNTNPKIAPAHLGVNAGIGAALDSLVDLRGSIVHTGKVPDTLRKGHVLEWRKFVSDLAGELEVTCRKQCKELLGS